MPARGSCRDSGKGKGKREENIIMTSEETGPVRGILNKHKSHLKCHNSYLFAVSMLLHAQQNPGGRAAATLSAWPGGLHFSITPKRKAFTSADKGREHVATKDETSSPH